MVKARWGRIINIASVVAYSGNPGQVNYAASKGGIVSFSKSLAAEIASRNITVNCIAPGFIESDMTKKLTAEQREKLLTVVPARRIGQPEDVANAVAFLASEEASYITGTTLHVNGGMYMI
jgi:3-oxoacyl-[acyl-carrier protein] reductase